MFLCPRQGKSTSMEGLWISFHFYWILPAGQQTNTRNIKTLDFYLFKSCTNTTLLWNEFPSVLDSYNCNTWWQSLKLFQVLLLARSRSPIGEALELVKAQLSRLHLEELKHIAEPCLFGWKDTNSMTRQMREVASKAPAGWNGRFSWQTPPPVQFAETPSCWSVRPV